MKVAIRTSHWHSLDVYHDLDADGSVACRFGKRDIPFHIVDRDTLPDHVNRCANCADEYDPATNTNRDWARELRTADDPEAVLRS